LAVFAIAEQFDVLDLDVEPPSELSIADGRRRVPVTELMALLAAAITADHLETTRVEGELASTG
jgi:hypothetical protein